MHKPVIAGGAWLSDEAINEAALVEQQRDELLKRFEEALATLKQIATRPASADRYDGVKGAASLQAIARGAIAKWSGGNEKN